MKRNIKNVLFIGLALMIIMMIQSCEELEVTPDLNTGYEPQTGKSTVDYFRGLSWDGDTEYDLFADLIVRSGVDLNNKTLFAPADNNWEVWMTDNGYATVADVPVDEIRDAILSHLVEGKKKRLDLDLPDRNPQTLEGTDIPSDITNMLGNTLKVNVNSFNFNGRGLQMRIGTSNASILVMTGDVENTDAIVHLYGFSNTRDNDKGLLLP